MCDYIHTISQTERYKHTRYAIIKNNNETVIVSEKKQSGFTIIELLVFCAIFVISGVAFSSVFLSILQVQSRQTATVEVSRESQFVIQKIQNYIENASVIDAPANTPATTLRLRMSDSARDPVIISQEGSKITIQEGSKPATPITSDRVVVSNFSLTKRDHEKGIDAVSVAITLTANTANPLKQFSSTLQTTIARVQAATFDSNLIPSSTAAYDVGVSGQIWRSINNLIYFSGSNVGVGTVSPQDPLDVGGRLRVSSGDVYVHSAGAGVILKSSGGTCARVTVANTTGAVTSTVVACP